MAPTRRRYQQTRSFEQRLKHETERCRRAAAKAPSAAARDLLLKKLQMTETAIEINAWLRAPDVSVPKAVRS